MKLNKEQMKQIIIRAGYRVEDVNFGLDVTTKADEYVVRIPYKNATEEWESPFVNGILND